MNEAFKQLHLIFIKFKCLLFSCHELGYWLEVKYRMYLSTQTCNISKLNTKCITDISLCNTHL